MIKFLYSVRDHQAGYAQPVAFMNDGLAVRSVQDCVRLGGGDMHNHPEDFSLYKVGSFDDVTGKIEPMDVFICHLVQLVKDGE